MSYFEKHTGYTHDLKIWGAFFNAVVNGKKTFEIRKMDRDYQEGDFLRLNEFNNESKEYTGRECLVLITYIYRRDDYMASGYGVMGIKLVTNAQQHQIIKRIERIRAADEDVGYLVQLFRELDHQVQSDRFFRHHLVRELDNFCAKLNPELRSELDKILAKLSAKERHDI